MSDDSNSLSLTARWVYPASGPPLERGVVTVRGDRIAAVEANGAWTADVDLGNVALIPGLVNPHTHLDLSGARGLIPPTDPDHFTDWLRGVIAYRRSRTPEQTRTDVAAGLAECLATGTTLIGDIAAEGQTWDVLAAAPTRALVFWELLGLSLQRFGGEFHRSFLGIESKQNTGTCVWGRSPHAPYSVHRRGYGLTFSGPGVYTTHIAESVAEVELIMHREGPFVSFLQSVGAWEADGLVKDYHFVSDVDPEALILLAHCNHLPHNVLLSPKHTLVYCPRTHAAFGHPPHPFRDFLARGVRVALGTDSLASNPDLDVLAEARFVRAHYPDFPGDTLLKMVTLSGAEALGWADETGSIEPGKSADLVAVPLPDRDAVDPYELLFAADAPVGGRRTMFRGAWRVGDRESPGV